MEFEIKKSIPIVSARGKTYKKYFWERMEIGDCVEFSLKDKPKHFRQNIIGSASLRGFKIKTHSDGIVMKAWRIA